MTRFNKYFGAYDIDEARKPISHIRRPDPQIIDQFMCGDKIEKTSVYVFPDRVEIHRQRKYRETQGAIFDTFYYNELSSVSLNSYLDTTYIRFNFKRESRNYISQDVISAPRNDDHYSYPNEVICGSQEDIIVHLEIIQDALAKSKTSLSIPTVNSGTIINITYTLNSLQQEINEQGGADVNELSELLDYVRKLLHTIEETGRIDKDPSIWEKILDCADRHANLFVEILKLIIQVFSGR